MKQLNIIKGYQTIIFIHMLSLFMPFNIYSAQVSDSQIDLTPDRKVLEEKVPQVIKEILPYSIKKGFGSDSSETMELFSNLSVIRYGTLTAGEAVLRTHTLRINPGSIRGYSLQVIQDHPLKGATAEIPDTSCDEGICTEKLASMWKSPLTYGFGFNCSKSLYCPSDFESTDFFRRLPSRSHKESPATLTYTLSSGVNEYEFTYQLNISSSQAQDNYQNTINYVVLPNL